MRLSKKKLETFGGMGSILTGLGCTAIGWMDYQDEQSIWKIWAVMFVVLVGNGIAMLLHAAKRVDDEGAVEPMRGAVKVRS